MTPIGTINSRNCCKIAINTLTLPYGTSPELWKKWGRQQPPCIIASHFTMCVLVWVFERGSLATPFLPSKMKCLFHTAGEILGAPYESVGTPHLRVGGIGRQVSTIYIYIRQVSFSGLVALFYATSMPTATGLDKPLLGGPLETVVVNGVWDWFCTSGCEDLPLEGWMEKGALSGRAGARISEK